MRNERDAGPWESFHEVTTECINCKVTITEETAWLYDDAWLCYDCALPKMGEAAIAAYEEWQNSLK